MNYMVLLIGNLADLVHFKSFLTYRIRPRFQLHLTPVYDPNYCSKLTYSIAKGLGEVKLIFDCCI